MSLSVKMWSLVKKQGHHHDHWERHTQGGVQTFGLLDALTIQNQLGAPWEIVHYLGGYPPDEGIVDRIRNPARYE